MYRKRGLSPLVLAGYFLVFSDLNTPPNRLFYPLHGYKPPMQYTNPVRKRYAALPRVFRRPSGKSESERRGERGRGERGKSEERAPEPAFLLSAPLFVSFSWQDGYTPLLIAAHEGKLEAVRLLMERGADVAAKDWVSMNGPSRARWWGETKPSL